MLLRLANALYFATVGAFYVVSIIALFFGEYVSGDFSSGEKKDAAGVLSHRALVLLMIAAASVILAAGLGWGIHFSLKWTGIASSITLVYTGAGIVLEREARRLKRQS